MKEFLFVSVLFATFFLSVYNALGINRLISLHCAISHALNAEMELTRLTSKTINETLTALMKDIESRKDDMK